MDGTEEPKRKPGFQPGQSGNPAGRPKGVRLKHIVALEALGKGEVEEIVQALILKAKQGDAAAAKHILDRVWPIRKGAHVEFDLMTISEAKDLPSAIAGITEQVAAGEITPDEGALVVGLLEAQRRAIETSELAERLAAVEASLANGGRS